MTFFPYSVFSSSLQNVATYSECSILLEKKRVQQAECRRYKKKTGMTKKERLFETEASKNSKKSKRYC